MNTYLLSTYVVEGKVPGAPSSPEEMQTFMQRVMDLEADMEVAGAFVFGGGLHRPTAGEVYVDGVPLEDIDIMAGANRQDDYLQYIRKSRPPEKSSHGWDTEQIITPTDAFVLIFTVLGCLRTHFTTP